MAINAGNFTEKDNLIAQFYALRAGLSAISEETEEIQSLENEIKRIKYENSTENRNAKQRYDKMLSEKSKETWPLRRKIENEEAEIGQLSRKRAGFCMDLSSCKSSDGYKRFIDKDAGTGIGCLLAFLGLTPGMGLGIGIGGELLGGLVLGLIFTAIWTGFVFWGLNYIKKRNAIKECNNRIFEINRDIANIDKEISARRNEIQKYQDQIDAIKNSAGNFSEPNPYQDKINSLQTSLEHSVIPTSTNNVKAIKKAMNQQFGYLITEADWGNVDLLIFYLNTGRADSLKEALLLVDKQKQTDQIVHAIRSAAEHMSATIRENTYRLSSVIVGCYSKLSDQINANHADLISHIETSNLEMQTLNRNIGTLNSQIGSLGKTIQEQGKAIADAERLNATLLKQSNKTSEELLHDLRYNEKYWLK